MAFKRIADIQAIPALAPGAAIGRNVNMTGFPKNRRLARLWIYADITLTRGGAPAVHAPQECAQFVQQILGQVGRHEWSITDGRDLYSYQEVARGSIFAGNPEMTVAPGQYQLRFPIPTSYILGGPGEIATRPPCEEFEAGSLNFTFTNPFAAGDVDNMVVNDFNLWAEHYSRGESLEETTAPGIKDLSKWGGFWASRVPQNGSLFQVTDVIPTMVLLRDRAWTTMQCMADGQELYSNIDPQQIQMVDSDRYDRFLPDPILGYQLAAVEVDSLRILNQIPGVAGAEDWTKLFDARNDRDARSPLEFQANGGYNFAGTPGAVIVGRRAVAGQPQVRV